MGKLVSSREGVGIVPQRHGTIVNELLEARLFNNSRKNRPDCTYKSL